LPQAEKLRRGSIGTLIVFVFTVWLVLLPMGLWGICCLCDSILISRARHFQEEILPAVYSCFDMEQLAEGRPVLKAAEAEELLRHLYFANMPAALRDRLRLVDIELLEQKILPDPGHWMGSSQPLQVPVVVMRSIYLDHQNQEITLRSAVELLTD
jgi:hypothetical protein